MEIEKAVTELSAKEQKELLRFLLRVIPVSEGDMPKPRIFSAAEIQSWLAEDEESMRQMRELT